MKHTVYTAYKNNKKYTGLDTIIGVGLENNQKKEIYSYRPQPSAWFVLDLETGRGNNSWFPGCLVKGNLEVGIEIKEYSDDESSTVYIVDDSEEFAKVITKKDSWYKIEYKNIEGYIKQTDLQNIKYTSHTN